MKKRKGLSYSVIPQRGKILSMDQTDWNEMTELDQRVYKRLKRRNYSAEQLNSDLNVPLIDIWHSLDKPLMRKYIFRKSLFMWGLITDYQRDRLYH